MDDHQRGVQLADAFMQQWFGSRWQEDAHLVEVWVALLEAFTQALAEGRARGEVLR